LSTLLYFQAEDSIRDLYVTGFQTCALPISDRRLPGDRLRVPDHRVRAGHRPGHALTDRENPEVLAVGQDQPRPHDADRLAHQRQIGRASCRERVYIDTVA